MPEITLGLTLETERLILRLPVEGDLDGWADMMSNEEVMRYLGGVISRAESWRLLAGTVGSWVLKGFGMFSVIEKETGEWIGRIGTLQPEGWPGTEVGWGLRRQYWGKGYTLEAAIASIDWAFDHLGWSEVIHCIAPENINSQKVAQRLGSKNLYVGQLPPPYKDPIDIWGQTCEEWRARRSILPLIPAKAGIPLL